MEATKHIVIKYIDGKFMPAEVFNIEFNAGVSMLDLLDIIRKTEGVEYERDGNEMGFRCKEKETCCTVVTTAIPEDCKRIAVYGYIEDDKYYDFGGIHVTSDIGSATGDFNNMVDGIVRQMEEYASSQGGKVSYAVDKRDKVEQRTAFTEHGRHGFCMHDFFFIEVGVE